MTITVRRDIAGSYVVVLLGTPRWCPHDQAYIDARKDVRTPDHSHIEYVRAGQVRHRETVPNTRAPGRIIDMVRNLKRGWPP